MQYLYSDGDLYNFMDTVTYDQIALKEETVACCGVFHLESLYGEYREGETIAGLAGRIISRHGEQSMALEEIVF